MSALHGARIHITGVVQGVGFRPFVYGLAKKLALTGWVRNTSAGVHIEVDGSEQAIARFVSALVEDAPPLARIDDIQVEACAPNAHSSFEIMASETIPEAYQPVSPDVSTCADCMREMRDASDRRYRYPFTNCTNCGPRFTIIEDIPYDRPNTTMAEFPMCAQCAEEYEDPLDRRFHAQPVACPQCGPQIWLEEGGRRVSEREEALQAVRSMLREGCIVAVKGLGGFHLACDATDAEAVVELRRRKLRVDKPFAVMMPDMNAVNAHCLMNEVERRLLESHERPIVILKRRAESNIVPEVAPGQDTLGVMLPYTPLHFLLLETETGYPNALVMTSGNLKEEPIATQNEEARENLNQLADAFLMHDRGIRTRCDDSVVCAIEDDLYPLRRSRGYAPFPVHLDWESPPMLAVGAELKNAFCLTQARYAFLSHHIGDMENYETLRSFEDGVAHYERLFRTKPEALAYDLHPDYLATRYALERSEHEGLPAVGVQHHHAHIAACMAEHGLDGDSPVIGVAFDGTGYGSDGAIWGGEFLLADYSSFERPFHLSYVSMPGGDAAVRQPWRLALAWLDRAGLAWAPDLPPVQAADSTALQTVRRMLSLGLNAPLTSSMGRLFDAVSALAGVRQTVNFEAQAAIEFEMLVDAEETGAYDFTFEEEEIDAAPLVEAVVEDLRSGTAVEKIAARFHNGVAAMVLKSCELIRERGGSRKVVLSGGVWQNQILLTRTLAQLRERDFEVYIHRQVPTNDGGIALGQAAVALQVLRER
ncbi:MAG TPA: carbamoyltransferase HypF [Anaerolineae bacterium]|nr:carbamoyltransferase HypF [Anaerolineae bacterium]